MSKYKRFKRETFREIDDFLESLDTKLANFVAESEDYSDFEERISVCDDILNDVSQELELISNDYYEDNAQRFIPESVYSTLAFQVAYLAPIYFADPNIYVDEIAPESIHKTLIKDFEEKASGDINIDLIKKSISSKLHKRNEFDVLELDFNFGELNNAGLYTKVFLPYRINNKFEIETLVPFFTKINNKTKNTEMYYFDIVEGANGPQVSPFFFKEYKNKDDLEVILEQLESSTLNEEKPQYYA